ncbi:MAG: M1 family aminopeptidase, partial [Phycisphaerales bacterium]|nr:M1 family aminopeptidase [Phycisphaerales bacterium]
MHLYIMSLLISAVPSHQSLSIRLDPSTNMVWGETTITVKGSGELHVDGVGNFTDLQDGERITFEWQDNFQDSVSAGERVGQIHNFSVDAHISEDGVFLSDWAPWYPKPVDENGSPYLRTMDLEVAPIEGWTFVASGNPVEGKWVTPRPVDGMALVGNKHVVASSTVELASGVVEIAVHLAPEHETKIQYYLEAAKDYLELYTPLLGAYPYDQFTIVENFFSSGFAYPGFTVLGPRVVGMAPKSLAPGYLDHELLHNWWGNGVYVDSSRGNWCEALTSYCTNYGRRALADGSEAARSYRRGILNKVSLDPSLDNGALKDFGSADPQDGEIDRFVGYDKGAFVFMMLEEVLNEGISKEANQSKIWQVLARFARDNMGRAASWKDIQKAAEQQYPNRPSGWLDSFFNQWVFEHNVPATSPELRAVPPQILEFDSGENWISIDPDYKYYRLFPKGQISPTIAGTLAGTT